MSQPAPFFDDICDAPEGAQAFWCTAKDGTRIRAAVWKGGARGTVLLLNGRTEYIEKYGALIGKLSTLGYSVLTLDWRGQGLSDRLDGRTDLGWVEDFSLYQQDIDAAFGAPEAQKLPKPIVMFAHSMGCCIGLRRALNDPSIKGAVFSAPMWGIGMSAPLKMAAGAIASAALALGLDKKHAPGTNGNFYTLTSPFEGNLLTNNTQCYAELTRHLKAHPELGLGGPSLRWVSAALRELRDLKSQQMPNLPALTFLGGEEGIVDPAEIRSLMPRLANGKLIELPTAKHEVWIETPDVQAAFWTETEAFLSQIS